ncbi:DUF4752 domain-containing protein [Citrobacter sp. Cf115]|uniref:DUF4752 domain-containing protein n=1 Tax=Citrobacter sp. Cf115 TaxID=2985066 RepID=UPI002581AEB0|nr:DUF4752 domain-containing protein [Citrobacter sp. Cf115]MDM3345374.1 DUF4752 domain-containing protein [Citrobacter sp. Cf115]
MQTINNRMTETQIADLFSLAVQLQVKAEESDDRDTAILAYSIQNACSNLTESQREFRAADATIHNLELKITDMAVQLANAESKCRELAEEISRRDEIFVPVYPDENTMNRMTDVFHDTAKIHCAEDSIFVDNAELVITTVINHYIKSDDAFLAEVRAQARNEGINYAAGRLAAAFNHGFVDKPLTEVCDVVRMILDAKEELANSTLPAADGISGEYAEKFLAEFAAQLRKGAAL